MRRSIMVGGLLAGLVVQPALAWLAYPGDDDPRSLIVEVERATGDIVQLADLPAPFGSLFLHGAAAERRSFRWRYDRQAEGVAFLAVTPAGRARLTVGFAARQPSEGKRYGAAITLFDGEGRALHTFYARADRMEGAAVRFRHSVTFELSRPPDWWKSVGALAFFRMTYHPGQGVEPRETWRAMRRAVWHLSKGAGTEQRQ